MPNTRVVTGQPRHMYGWRKDLPDHRDKSFKVARLKSIFLPRSVDLRPKCPRVENQGDIGSCTANATTSAIEFLLKRDHQRNPELSRLFVYYATRVWVASQSPSIDEGASIRDVMKAVAQYGACLETVWPYEVAKFSTEPSVYAKRDALNRQVLCYRRCPSLRDVRACLAGGYPCVGGFAVPERVTSERVSRTGVIPYPSPKENFIGGHAVLFVGYDDRKKWLVFQNSWGTDWGDKGFGYLPYVFVEKSLASDFWTVNHTEG